MQFSLQAADSSYASEQAILGKISASVLLMTIRTTLHLLYMQAHLDSSNSTSVSLLDNSPRPFCCSCIRFPSRGKTRITT